MGPNESRNACSGEVSPSVHAVSATRIPAWLAAGWRDLRANPIASRRWPRRSMTTAASQAPTTISMTQPMLR